MEAQPLCTNHFESNMAGYYYIDPQRGLFWVNEPHNNSHDGRVVTNDWHNGTGWYGILMMANSAKTCQIHIFIMYVDASRYNPSRLNPSVLRRATGSNSSQQNDPPHEYRDPPPGPHYFPSRRRRKEGLLRKILRWFWLKLRTICRHFLGCLVRLLEELVD